MPRALANALLTGSIALSSLVLVGCPDETETAALSEAEVATESSSQAAGTDPLAEERGALADERGGLLGRSYGKVRGAALGVGFKSLALAADQAPKAERLDEAAQHAEWLAAALEGRPPVDEPAWPEVAAVLRTAGGEPPPRVGLYLGGAYLVTGHMRLALFELSAIDPAELPTPEERSACVLARAMVYRARGYDGLALAEVTALEDPEQGWGPELQACLRVLEAALLLERLEVAEADVKLAEAVQVWPESPVAVFLTGEQQAADGEWEQAAQSLERLAAGTRSAWLAERCADRARQIRDAEGPPPPLLHDPEFVRRLSWESLADAARSSDAAARVHRTLAAARGLAERLRAKLPGAH